LKDEFRRSQGFGRGRRPKTPTKTPTEISPPDFKIAIGTLAARPDSRSVLATPRLVGCRTFVTQGIQKIVYAPLSIFREKDFKE
jgi:hypothetical protein